MAFAVTGVVVRIQLLDSSGAAIYTGDPNTSIYAWGAQLELNEYYEDALQDLTNYRYIRTRGVTSSHWDQRFGLDNSLDTILPEERIYKSLRLTAHSAGTFLNTQIERIDNTSGNAVRTQEIFIPETWYQLAPLYASYVNLFNNPNSTRDGVTVGELDSVNLDQVYDYNLQDGYDDYQDYVETINIDFRQVSNLDVDTNFDMVYEATGTADLLIATSLPFPSDLLA